MAPFELPIDVALARPVEDFPTGPGLLLSPKVDGWRAVLRTGTGAALFSRHGTDLSRTFADLIAVAGELPDATLDGEVLAVLPDGSLSFALLQTRAGGGPRRGEPFTVHYAAFDLLGLDDDWRPRPHAERHARLLRLLDDGPRAVQALPATEDPDQARGWIGGLGGGVEGIVAKPTDRPYLPRYSSNWAKWRRRHTTDAVVVGITGSSTAQQAAVIAQPDAHGRLRPVGVTLPLGTRLRTELAPLLRPAGESLAELPGTVAGLPGQPSFLYQPVLPDVVLEIPGDRGLPDHAPKCTTTRKGPASLMPARSRAEPTQQIQSQDKQGLTSYHPHPQVLD
ncbi:ATP-dependent DNA ligase [Kitasatospora sp. NPDC088346]|uniref:ATP-dependent DNA ligase n=1 Tax=Kitasatospora sp. NPDC088346 TaxID=3364073 RepID=UPI003827C04D